MHWRKKLKLYNILMSACFGLMLAAIFTAHISTLASLLFALASVTAFITAARILP